MTLYNPAHFSNLVFISHLNDSFLCLFTAGDQCVSRPGRCWADLCDFGSVRNQRSEVNTTHTPSDLPTCVETFSANCV